MTWIGTSSMILLLKQKMLLQFCPCQYTTTGFFTQGQRVFCCYCCFAAAAAPNIQFYCHFCHQHHCVRIKPAPTTTLCSLSGSLLQLLESLCPQGRSVFSIPKAMLQTHISLIFPHRILCHAIFLCFMHVPFKSELTREFLGTALLLSLTVSPDSDLLSNSDSRQASKEPVGDNILGSMAGPVFPSTTFLVLVFLASICS